MFAIKVELKQLTVVGLVVSPGQETGYIAGALWLYLARSMLDTFPKYLFLSKVQCPRCLWVFSGLSVRGSDRFTSICS